MKILLIVIMFLLLGAFFIISNNNLALAKDDNIGKFAEQYSEWLGGLSENVVGITGYAVKMEWLPK